MNDAYELLSDPNKKALFDKFGKVNLEDSVDGSGLSTNMYFGSMDKAQIKNEFTVLTSSNFHNPTHITNDCMFLVYREFVCDECDLYLGIFAEFQKRFP